MKRQSEAGKPSNDEIAGEVKRIVNSETFAVHPKLCDLLNALVRGALNDEWPREEELGVALFDKPKSWRPWRESAVRERKSSLRKELYAYYVNEGKFDPVIIEFPNRGRMRVFYNLGVDPATLVAEAQLLMHKTLPQVIPQNSLKVISLLEECVGRYPSYAPAHAALAEALLLYTACDMPRFFPVGESILRAEEAARMAVQLDVRLWDARIVVGALHCCRFHWEEADAAFHTARCIDPERTNENLFYLCYLAAVGTSKQHRERFATRGAKRDEVLDARIYGLSRYLSSTDPLFKYEGYYGLMNITTSSREIESDQDYQEGRRLLRFDFWLGYYLAALVFLQLDEDELAVRYAETAVEESNMDVFPGIKLLTYGAYGKEHPPAIRAIREHIKRWRGGPQPLRVFMDGDESDIPPTPISAFSYALTYMALGKATEAIQKLNEACDEGYPWIIFLHRWPFLYRLRQEKAFEKLLERMNLPNYVR